MKMNERIKQIAEQSGFIPWSDEPWRPDDVVFDWSSNYDEELEKFADNIIQKCISEVALFGISNFENEDISWVVDKIVKNIKQTFGKND